MDQDVQVDLKADTVTLFGICYSLQLFRVIARRLPPGTRMETFTNAEGRPAVHHFTPAKP